MALPITAKKAFFSIERLADIPKAMIREITGEVIEIYMVLSGKVTILIKDARVTLKEKEIYWTCYDRYNRFIVDHGAQGFAIRFDKALIRARREFSCSYLPEHFPFPVCGETIAAGNSFISEAGGLCEMMLQEFQGESHFKLEVISALMSLFLLQLMRRTNIALYIMDSKMMYQSPIPLEDDRSPVVLAL